MAPPDGSTLVNKLYIVRGLPGSGKSTLAKQMMHQGIVDSYYEADMFFMINGKYQFNPAKLKYAHEWCFEVVRHALLTREENVAVSNTFTMQWEAEKYIALCQMNGVGVEIITCTGNFKSVHDVPEEAMEKMRARFVADTSDWI